MSSASVGGGSRLARFADALERAGFAAAVVSYHRDVLYLTGTAQPCNLLVVPGSPPTLFARRFADLARAQSRVEDVVGAAGLGAVRDRLNALRRGGGRLGMTLDVVPAALARKAAETFAEWQIDDAAPVLAELRMIKDSDEIAALRRSAALFEVVHATMCGVLRPGVTELEVASEITGALRAAGHDGLAFQRRWDANLHPEGAIASGDRLWTFSGQAITVTGTGLGGAVPFGASRRALAMGDSLVIDLGLVVDGYHADMARTYGVGPPEDDVVRLAVAARAIEDAALAAIRPGVPAHAVYDAARDQACELGVDRWFQGWGEHHGPYIGHGLGLEMDEPPVLGPRVTTPLAEGMVLAVEPKLILPGVGAMNLEDDVVVRREGAELLSAFPRTAFWVEGGAATPLPVA